MQVILKDEIIQKLKEVGLKSGDTVMVHTSLGKMGYVCGGAQAVIEALMEVVGDSGTIMMPTQSWNKSGSGDGGSLGGRSKGLAAHSGQLAGL